MSLIDNGVFVATKITCTPETQIIDFLLKKTDARDKEDLNQHLQSWNKAKKISRIFHPIREKSNEGIREHILGLIQETPSTKILGINVSALYPSETKDSLERMFMSVMEATLTNNIKMPLTSLSDHDKVLSRYSAKDFWQRFDETLCHQEESIGLLKEFCIIPYTKALRRVEGESEEKRQDHIKSLRRKRQDLVDDIGRRTELRAREVVSSFIPQKNKNDNREDDFVFFDFAYHKDYYDQVCGTGSIHHLATDPLEQEIVRQYYAGFIARHSHEQMMRWQQRFSGVGELTKRLALMEEELKKLKSPAVEGKKLIERPIKVAIPEVARGFEDIYERFLKGVLVYRPTEGSDVGKIELPIAALTNPLGSIFDLSSCGDTGQYLSIATGYRKVQSPTNANKVEIWLTPRFLVDKEMPQLAQNHHIRAISGNWDAARAPIGIFWTWGGWNEGDQMAYCDYLTTESMDEASSENLLKKYQKARAAADGGG